MANLEKVDKKIKKRPAAKSRKAATAAKTQAANDSPAPGSKEHLAQCATNPSISGAAVVEAFAKTMIGEQDITMLASELSDANRLVHNGDLQRAESMLMSQAHALQIIFVSMARRSAINAGEYINASDTYMRMALRAQNQCRMTLETLSTIKNPPVVFAKQANIAHGHQQVNNGSQASHAHAHAAENQNPPDEQDAIRHDPSPTLDTGATCGTSRAHQDRETVGARHRPEDGRR